MLLLDVADQMTTRHKNCNVKTLQARCTSHNTNNTWVPQQEWTWTVLGAVIRTEYINNSWNYSPTYSIPSWNIKLYGLQIIILPNDLTSQMLRSSKISHRYQQPNCLTFNRNT